MAAMTSTIPTAAGVLTTAGTAVSASDTVTQTQLGSRGCFLEVLNGGASPDTVTITDSGFTPAGNAAAVYTVAVTNATNKIIYLDPSLANVTTGLLTIAHSFITSVTYKLYPLG